MRGLLVTARMASPTVAVAGKHLNLDGLLYAGVMIGSPPKGTERPIEECAVPIPARLSWVSPDGRPLWACGTMRPIGEARAAPQWIHKRYEASREPLQRQRGANTSAGRWKDARVPLRPSLVEAWSGVMIGNADAVRWALEHVTTIGKKGALGFGRVASWDVAEIDVDEDDVLSMRAVPMERAGTADRMTAWTPPYWYQPAWRLCREAVR